MTNQNKEPNGWDDGWDERCGVYHCSDGEHLSFWLTLIKTDEWKRWSEYARNKIIYDIPECEECGWISEQHIKDFLAFTRRGIIDECIAFVMSEKNPEKLLEELQKLTKTL